MRPAPISTGSRASAIEYRATGISEQRTAWRRVRTPRAIGRRAPLLAGLVALAIAGCSAADSEATASDTAAATTVAPAADAGPSTAPPAADTPPRPGRTVGGDGSAIELAPLATDDIEAAALTGELACSFATGTAAPLLLAAGNVASADPAFGIVKIGDVVERIASPGGFDAMIDGATFGGRGTTIRIALTGPATGGGESPPRPATLTFDRGDGAQRVFAGRWVCGP